jgi:hypothetical protein
MLQGRLANIFGYCFGTMKIPTWVQLIVTFKKKASVDQNCHFRSHKKSLWVHILIINLRRKAKGAI